MHQIVLDLAVWFTGTVPGSALLLDASRFFVVFTMLMTLLTALKLAWRYPTVLAFWLALAPMPFVLSYYLSQIYLNRIDPIDATVARLYVNTFMGFLFAGYWTLSGMLTKLYREKYGPGRAGMRRIMARLRQHA